MSDLSHAGEFRPTFKRSLYVADTKIPSKRIATGYSHIGLIEFRIGVRSTVGVSNVQHQLTSCESVSIFILQHFGIPPLCERQFSRLVWKNPHGRDVAAARIPHLHHNQSALGQEITRVQRTRGV